MKKNFIALIIVLIGQLKGGYIFPTSEQGNISIKKAPYLKESKNSRKHHATNLLKPIKNIDNIGNKSSKKKLITNWDYFFSTDSAIIFLIKAVLEFDFNSINLLFFGCCNR